MNNIQYLHSAKAFLRGVIASRRWLVKHKKGFVDTDFAKTQCNNIENAIATIVSAYKMKTYLERNEGMIRILIPTSTKKKYRKLKELLDFQLIASKQTLINRNQFQKL